MTAPERIYAQEPDIFDGLGLYYFTRGKPEDVEYIRSDLCDRDTIRAEAFEEAARVIECAYLHSDKSKNTLPLSGLNSLAKIIRSKIKE